MIGLVLSMIVSAVVPHAVRQATPALKVSDAWIRAAAAQQVTGGYAVFDNPGNREVVITAARTSVAKTVELHVMTEQNSMMKMQRVERFVVPAGGRLALAPGAAHLMFFGVNRPLPAGEEITLTFTLSDGREFDVRFTVRPRDGM